MKDLRRIRVLTLDDGATMRAIIRTLLLGLGINQVFESPDAANAFEALRLNQVDIALVDYVMDGLNGAEFIELLRNAEDSPCPDLPIIVLTAHSTRQKAVEVIRAGAQSVLVKPISALRLAQHMNAVLGGFSASP